MSLERTLVAGRQAAEARMLDRCRAGVEVNGPKDPDTLLPTVRLEARYEGICQITSNTATVSERATAGQQFVEQMFVLQVPVGSTVHIGDLVEVTAVDPVIGNAELLRARFRVQGHVSVSQSTKAKFVMERIS